MRSAVGRLPRRHGAADGRTAAKPGRSTTAPGTTFALLAVWFANDRPTASPPAPSALRWRPVTADGTWKELTVGAGDDHDRHLNAISRAQRAALHRRRGRHAVRSPTAADLEALRLPYKGSLVGRHGARRRNRARVRHARARLRSADQGRTWTDVPTGTEQSWSGGRKFADGTIVLVGSAARRAQHRRRQSFQTTIRPSGRRSRGRRGRAGAQRHRRPRRHRRTQPRRPMTLPFIAAPSTINAAEIRHGHETPRPRQRCHPRVTGILAGLTLWAAAGPVQAFDRASLVLAEVHELPCPAADGRIAPRRRSCGRPPRMDVIVDRMRRLHGMPIGAGR